MKYYTQKIDEVYHDLDSSPKGLSGKEAEERLEKYGKNEIVRKREIKPFMIFLSQFKDFIIWILIAAAGVSIMLGIYSGQAEEWIDAIVIIIILVLNAFLGFIKEYRAEKSIEALKKMTSLKTVALRNNKEQKIDAHELVPGDIVFLEVGEKVPADARLIEATALECEEAALTGESLPVEKKTGTIKEGTAVADRSNMVFNGTVVTRGHGKAIVTATGMKTQLGRIAGMIQEAESPKTPLQNKLAHFGKVLGGIVILVCVIVIIVGIFRGYGTLTMFLAAVSLAVAAVPEGLPAVVTITLSIGVQKMAKRNALIRKLPSVETLGCTTVISSDKTGTLTHNEMTVTKVYCDGQVIDVRGEGYKTKGEFEKKTEDLKQLLKIGVLCNDAKLNGEEVVGDPTEAALLVSAAKLGMRKEEMNRLNPRVDELPFDSERKMMTTINKVNNSKYAFTKGAPDVILSKCNKILENGKTRILTKKDRDNILAVNEQFARSALRVLGFAYKEIKYEKINEESLIFVGLQAMIDPPRKEAVTSVEMCKKAGIKVIMVTGDHKITAQAIAKKLGISGRAITGVELDKLNDEEFARDVEKISIFARVNPAHKTKIIKALEKHGHVTAMTGDGVNDAPALKRADIGVAMGITGTDVSKEASDMVLLDDNFSSLVSAVEEGRTIFDNIQKFVEYLLSCNMGEVLVILSAIIAGLKLPLLPLQILWMNLVTDGLPALALGVDPEEPGVMDRPPREKGTKIVSRNGFIRMLALGAIMAAGTLVVFIAFYDNLEHAQTMAFTTLVMFQMFQVLNTRSLTKSLFSVGVFKNRWLWAAIGTSVFLQLMVVYSPLNKIFHTVPLSLYDWGFVILISLSVFVIREVWKLFSKH
ncbi:calcium-transporting P-type ATPase, PMR1-type [Candidatus Woesearchaeota archaeon]|nr:calcium-transporting P-type ATPase, PMR1-type [Candidatus Woesearchaeota archaeon]